MQKYTHQKSVHLYFRKQHFPQKISTFSKTQVHNLIPTKAKNIFLKTELVITWKVSCERRIKEYDKNWKQDYGY